MKWLTAAGIAAPIAFTTLVLVQGLLQPDYDHVALPISMLAAWPLGWMQVLNFFLYGSLLLAFFLGLHRGMRPGHGDWLGVAPLLVCALGALVAGAFSVGRGEGGFTIPAGHELGGFMHFLGAPLGVLAMSRRMARHPEWRSMAPFSVAMGLVLLGGFLLLAFFARGEGKPLYPWLGLVQRAYLVVWFSWLIAVALRLGRVAGHPSWW